MIGRFDKLKVGDTIVVKGVPYKIQEIYEQDFYDDADSRKYNLPDKSYIDIEFKDTNGKYHHWKSNVDGGKIIYAGLGSRMFSEYFLSGKYTLKDTILKMQKLGNADAQGILNAIIDTIGDTVWEDN